MNEDNENINITLITYFCKKGADILNYYDDFFQDHCNNVDFEGKDIILKDRKQFYQNATLCQSGCKYNKKQVCNKQLIQCKCPYGILFNGESGTDESLLVLTSKKKSTWQKVKDQLSKRFNYKVVTCITRLTKFEFTLVSYIFLIFCYVFYRKRSE